MNLAKKIKNTYLLELLQTAASHPSAESLKKIVLIKPKQYKHNFPTHHVPRRFNDQCLLFTLNKNKKSLLLQLEAAKVSVFCDANSTNSSNFKTVTNKVFSKSNTKACKSSAFLESYCYNNYRKHKSCTGSEKLKLL